MSERMDLSPGTEFAAKPYLLDDAAAAAYAQGVKEPSRRKRKNIHSDPDAAAKAGFRAPIAAGEQTIAVAMQVIVDRFGERFLRGGKFEVALIKPVLFGDTITPHARIAGSENGNLKLDVWVENQKGEKVLSGDVRVRR